MSCFHHAKELWEFWTSKVGCRAKSSKQTALSDLLKVLLTDVLNTHTHRRQCITVVNANTDDETWECTDAYRKLRKQIDRENARARSTILRGGSIWGEILAWRVTFAPLRHYAYLLNVYFYDAHYSCSRSKTTAKGLINLFFMSRPPADYPYPGDYPRPNKLPTPWQNTHTPSRLPSPFLIYTLLLT